MKHFFGVLRTRRKKNEYCGGDFTYGDGVKYDILRPWCHVLIGSESKQQEQLCSPAGVGGGQEGCERVVIMMEAGVEGTQKK